jgi:hypothetical protein
MKKENVIGKAYGRLRVIKDMPNIKGHRRVLCECECGTIKEYSLGLLRNGDIRSCTCLRKELNTTHNKTKHPLFQVWAGMTARCTNKNHFGSKYYKGKNIVVCEEWRNFANFYEWSIKNGYQKGLTIDRINNGANYEPNNCRWVTRRENARNRDSTLYIAFNNEIKPLAEWCEILSIKYQKVYDRLYVLKWDVKRALTTK